MNKHKPRGRRPRGHHAFLSVCGRPLRPPASTPASHPSRALLPATALRSGVPPTGGSWRNH
eukprot:4727610-Pyramimonas_sp.AAC.1